MHSFPEQDSTMVHVFSDIAGVIQHINYSNYSLQKIQHATISMKVSKMC